MADDNKTYTFEELEKSLRKQQKKLCRLFLRTGNKAKSMEAVGYSKNTISKLAYRTFNNPKIKLYLDYLRKDVEGVTRTSKIKSIYHSSILADFNIKSVYDEAGELIPLHLLSDEVAYCIAGVRYQSNVVDGELMRQKYYLIKDQHKAEVEIRKMLGYYEPEKLQIVETEIDLSKLSTEELLLRLELDEKLKKE